MYVKISGYLAVRGEHLGIPFELMIDTADSYEQVRHFLWYIMCGGETDVASVNAVPDGNECVFRRGLSVVGLVLLALIRLKSLLPSVEMDDVPSRVDVRCAELDPVVVSAGHTAGFGSGSGTVLPTGTV